MDKQLMFKVIVHVLCMCMQCAFTHQKVHPVHTLKLLPGFGALRWQLQQQTKSNGRNKGKTMHITNNTDDLCTE